LRGGVLRAAHDRRDLGVGQVEHVVQHEREPLGRRQGLEDDEQRDTDGIGKHRFLFWVDGIGRGDGSSLVERLLGPCVAGPQHVQADVRDDRRQPAAQIVDVADVGAVHPQPRILHGVVGLGQRPQHAVGDRPQMRTVLLERVAVHVAPPPVIFRSGQPSSL
jgi:hypothetical protein